MKRRHAVKRPQPHCPKNCSGGRSLGSLRELLPGEIERIGSENLPTPDDTGMLRKCSYCGCIWNAASSRDLG